MPQNISVHNKKKNRNVANSTSTFDPNDFFDSEPDISTFAPFKRRKSKKKSNRNNYRQVFVETLTINYQLKDIKPKTINQKKVFDYYNQGYHVCLTGSAGCGKTFLSLYLALKDVLHARKYSKIIIIRSTVATRDIGFLPGTADDKIAVYEAPYQMLCTELFGRSNAYQMLKEKGIIEFRPTSFLRGQTLDDAVVIFDEAQNANFQEIATVVTRLGQNAKLMLCGDFKQCDLQYTREKTGIVDILNILKSMDSVRTVKFTTDDIVRSGFVKEFLIAEEEYFSRKNENV